MQQAGLVIEPGKLYRTRDGRKAYIYAKACGGNYPIHGAVWDAVEEAWEVTAWTTEGRFWPHRETGRDLVAEWGESDTASGEPKLFIEPGRYYRTRGGDKAYVAGKCPFEGACEDSLYVGWILRPSGTPILRSWGQSGIWEWGRDSDDDLVAEWREPIKFAGWVNVYPNGHSTVHETKTDADRWALTERIACVYVRGVEGEVPTDAEDPCK